MKQTATTILRWIAVPITAVVSYLVIAFVSNLFFKNSKDEEGSYTLVSLIAPILSALISGYAATILSALVAPAHKWVTAIWIGILLFFSVCGLVINAMYNNGVFQWMPVFSLLAMIAGIVGACKQVKEDAI